MAQSTEQRPQGAQIILDKLNDLGFTCSWQVDKYNKFIEHYLRRPTKHGESPLQVMVIQYKESGGISLFLEAGADSIDAVKAIDDLEWWIEKYTVKE